ncbi:4-diphosphocytidyl-2-C-methyl-D-erythritol kinase chloroplastic [Bienertia sinuspersici]
MAFASCGNTDVWKWIQNLPPLSQWNKDSMSICICSSNSSLETLSLNLTKNTSTQSLSFSINANLYFPVSLWVSKPVHVSSNSLNLLSDEKTIYSLISNFIEDVLKYGLVNKIHPVKIPKFDTPSNLKPVFNVSILTLAFLVSIYEAPTDLRFNCLKTLKDELSTAQSREASKLLIRFLGSNIEEQWMRCLNLAITNWKMELKAANHILKGPSPLFSHAHSTSGLWKVQLYCPIITMEVENTSGSADDRLAFSLNYHHLEGVIQLNYKVIVKEKWIEVMVNIDNIRLDVVRLVSDKLLHDRGAGAAEKHFPSKISLRLTPSSQTEVLSVSVSKSSENPRKEIEVEKAVEGSFEPNKLGIQVSAAETTTTIFKPWKFEETATGDTGGLNWFLHDSNDGREVFSSKPSPMTLFQPKAWFRHRYSSAYRPFTRQGGVIFAGDQYGETVCWKVDKSAMGKKATEWELAGSIGLTYWPNRYRTFYNETRRAEFRETVQLSFV